MQLQNTSMPIQGPAEQAIFPFKILNGMAYFSGKCDECRPFCASVCCRGYGFVSITAAEANSGRYIFRTVTENCDCDTCRRMRELGIQFALRRLPDGSCIYLDGSRKCAIYEDRPETCRKYSCTNVAFTLNPAS